MLPSRTIMAQNVWPPKLGLPAIRASFSQQRLKPFTHHQCSEMIHLGIKVDAQNSSLSATSCHVPTWPYCLPHKNSLCTHSPGTCPSPSLTVLSKRAVSPFPCPGAYLGYLVFGAASGSQEDRGQGGGHAQGRHTHVAPRCVLAQRLQEDDGEGAIGFGNRIHGGQAVLSLAPMGWGER